MFSWYKTALIASDLTFRDESVGSHHGQTDMVLSAFDSSGKYVGRIDYSIYNGEPSIRMISVPLEYRRKGIGTALLIELQTRFPGIEIGFGIVSEDGWKLINSLRTTYIPDPTYDELSEKMKRLEAEKAEIEARMGEWYDLPEDKRNEFRDRMLADGVRWEAVVDVLDGIGERIRGLRRGKTLVRTDLD